MIHLLTAQGVRAKTCYLPNESVENFKSLVRSVVGGSVFVVSAKFKTDIFYEASIAQHEAVKRLWMLYACPNGKGREQQPIRAYSGDEEALRQFFNSLSLFSLNRLPFNSYLRSFRDAYRADPGNYLAKRVIECDQHVVAEYETKGLSPRETLVAIKETRPSYTIESDLWKRITAAEQCSSN